MTETTEQQDCPAAPDPHAYYEHVRRADERLRDELAGIRQRQDAGELTVRAAADERVSALEEHLANCRELREKYLEGSAENE